MFIDIVYQKPIIDNWTGRYRYDYLIHDTEWTEKVSFDNNGYRVGKFRDSFVLAVYKKYHSKKLPIASNIALFYAREVGNHVDLDAYIDKDASFVEKLTNTPFKKKYVNCIRNQIKKLKFCGKLRHVPQLPVPPRRGRPMPPVFILEDPRAPHI